MIKQFMYESTDTYRHTGNDIVYLFISLLWTISCIISNRFPISFILPVTKKKPPLKYPDQTHTIHAQFLSPPCQRSSELEFFPCIHRRLI
ncbi:hypothetical protein QVD17_05979 [Tagetes erecta]|uniref:Uncharacterized protein n=1 Tax=Tagetes erecta TaxID=13708 RepID=A0AAD8LG21_TARER|nr:hypothetical protein QVD17_05979 [Tagetes erecta]